MPISRGSYLIYAWAQNSAWVDQNSSQISFDYFSSHSEPEMEISSSSQKSTGIVFWFSLIDPTQTWECINSRPYLDSKVNLRSTKNGHFQLLQSLHQEKDLSFWGNLAVCPPVKKLQVTQGFFAITFDICIMKDQNLCSSHSLHVKHCQSLLEF